MFRSVAKKKLPKLFICSQQEIKDLVFVIKMLCQWIQHPPKYPECTTAKYSTYFSNTVTIVALGLQLSIKMKAVMTETSYLDHSFIIKQDIAGYLRQDAEA